jgi:GNAT superfamily N-acetyltransferase
MFVADATCMIAPLSTAVHLGDGLTLRGLGPRDGAALAVLARTTPDTGRLQTAPEYPIDAWRAISGMRPATVGLGLEAGDGRLAAVIFASVDLRRVGDRVRRCALMHSLAVNPDFRRRGLATRLMEHLAAHLRAELGPEVLLVGNVQERNVGSFGASQRILPWTAGAYVASLAPLHCRPPGVLPGLSVREPRASEIERIAVHLDTFYSGYALRPAQTAQMLARWIAAGPPEAPLHRYLLAVDDAGELRAGLGLTDPTPVRVLRVHRVPWALEVLGRMLGVLHAERLLRQPYVELAWAQPGYEATLGHLWQMARWLARDGGGLLVSYFDPRGPIDRMTGLSWLWPRMTVRVMVSDPGAIEGRLIYPML